MDILFFENISLPVTPRRKMKIINFEALSILNKKGSFNFSDIVDRLRDIEAQRSRSANVC